MIKIGIIWRSLNYWRNKVICVNVYHFTEKKGPRNYRKNIQIFVGIAVLHFIGPFFTHEPETSGLQYIQDFINAV